MRVRKITASVVRKMMPELRAVPNDELGAIQWAINATMTRDERAVARTVMQRDIARRVRQIGAALLESMNRLERDLNNESDPT